MRIDAAMTMVGLPLPISRREPSVAMMEECVFRMLARVSMLFARASLGSSLFPVGDRAEKSKWMRSAFVVSCGAYERWEVGGGGPWREAGRYLLRDSCRRMRGGFRAVFPVGGGCGGGLVNHPTPER